MHRWACRAHGTPLTSSDIEIAIRRNTPSHNAGLGIQRCQTASSDGRSSATPFFPRPDNSIARQHMAIEFPMQLPRLVHSRSAGRRRLVPDSRKEIRLGAGRPMKLRRQATARGRADTSRFGTSIATMLQPCLLLLPGSRCCCARHFAPARAAFSSAVTKKPALGETVSRPRAAWKHPAICMLPDQQGSTWR